MTEAKLDALAEPTADLTEPAGVPIFAVGHQHGIVQKPNAEREYEANAVLYVTADGEQWAECWVRGTKNDLIAVDRVKVVDPADLDETPEHLRKWAPIARKHPEV